MHGITGQKPLHHRCHRHGPGLEQKMKMLCEVPNYVKLFFHLPEFLTFLNPTIVITPHNFIL
jgi:hypothetical protein